MYKISDLEYVMTGFDKATFTFIVSSLNGPPEIWRMTLLSGGVIKIEHSVKSKTKASSPILLELINVKITPFWHLQFMKLDPRLVEEMGMKMIREKI